MTEEEQRRYRTYEIVHNKKQDNGTFVGEGRMKVEGEKSKRNIRAITVQTNRHLDKQKY